MEIIEDVLIALRRLMRATDLHSRHLVKTAGLTAPQLLLMQAIHNRGEVAIGELAAERGPILTRDSTDGHRAVVTVLGGWLLGSSR